MGYSFTFKSSNTGLGKTSSASNTITADNTAGSEETPNAAKNGTLSTRTDNTTGTLTMSAGHGFTTGAKLDIYWNGGSRYNVTIGTVATNSVPFSLGAGDNLPASTTVITAMIPVVDAFVITGDNLEAIQVGSFAIGTVKFLDASNALLYAVRFKNSGGDAWGWYLGSPVANPLAGAAIAKVAYSHSDNSSARTMQVAALYD